MFDCHHLFGTFIACNKVRWEECHSAKKEENIVDLMHQMAETYSSLAIQKKHKGNEI